MAQNVTDTSPVTKMSQNKLTLPPECFACGEETEWKLTSGKKETMEVKGESYKYLLALTAAQSVIMS
ncbi:hypothetical protein [Rubritalea profundi]|uniref:Uncharacterized protein n=1 Tax=Rubritalea profundi TaxID=1658618 RepID=A0A2S7U5H9_9BACT|nr:hypothetical protein [Rubritalea profundi]PQJ29654.1 hypothetical protein BSZ32_14920 [Rubritalea profundi]